MKLKQIFCLSEEIIRTKSPTTYYNDNQLCFGGEMRDIKLWPRGEYYFLEIVWKEEFR